MPPSLHVDLSLPLCFEPVGLAFMPMARPSCRRKACGSAIEKRLGVQEKSRPEIIVPSLRQNDPRIKSKLHKNDLDYR
jgi:hypothetical protein